MNLREKVLKVLDQAVMEPSRQPKQKMKNRVETLLDERDALKAELAALKAGKPTAAPTKAGAELHKAIKTAFGPGQRTVAGATYDGPQNLERWREKNAAKPTLPAKPAKPLSKREQHWKDTVCAYQRQKQLQADHAAKVQAEFDAMPPGKARSAFYQASRDVLINR